MAHSDSSSIGGAAASRSCSPASVTVVSMDSTGDGADLPLFPQHMNSNKKHTHSPLLCTSSNAAALASTISAAAAANNSMIAIAHAVAAAYNHNNPSVSNLDTSLTTTTNAVNVSDNNSSDCNFHVHGKQSNRATTTTAHHPTKKKRPPSLLPHIYTELPLDITEQPLLKKQKIMVNTSLSSSLHPSRNNNSNGGGSAVKVRRTHSPKTIPSPKSSPVTPLPVSPKTRVFLRNNNSACRLMVRRVAPTVNGVAEGARVIRPSNKVGGGGGTVMAIPTETVYCLVTAIQLNKKKSQQQPYPPPLANQANNNSNNSTHATNPIQAWSAACNKLMQLQGNKGVPPSPPLLFVQTLSELDRIVTFPLRAYAIQMKQPAPTTTTTTVAPLPTPTEMQGTTTAPARASACSVSSVLSLSSLPPISSSEMESSSCALPRQHQQAADPTHSSSSLTLSPSEENTTTAPSSQTTPNSSSSGLVQVALNETREILNRLKTRFWPGPLEIYIPAGASRKEEHATTSILGTKHFSSNSNPCFPGEMLHHFNNNDEGEAKGDTILYLGIKCPSHPLTNRVLKEVTKPEQLGENHSTATNASGLIVIGVDCLAAANSNMMTKNSKAQPSLYCTKATDVCNSLLRHIQIESSSSSVSTSATASLPRAPSNQQQHQHQPAYVLNGEDKRELFAVPTCQYGKPHGASLWISDPKQRTIFICGTTNKEEKDISVGSIQRALSASQQKQKQTVPMTPNLTRRKNRDRVVRAVLRKWNVVDLRV